jgi:prolipoprotein diacylglyceryltransferase
MNSEIVGKPTTLPWGFKFLRCDEDAQMAQFHSVSLIPARHPSQLYEALYCVILFVLMFYLWKYKRQVLPQGFMFGLFCVLLFTGRFLMEFLKETQVDWEKGLALDMGQWLSIPFVLGGAFIMLYSYQKQKRSLE